MKAKWIWIIPVVILGLIVVNIFVFSKLDACGRIEKFTGLHLSLFDIKKTKDSHGGFLGDGEYIVIADCRKKKVDVEKLEGWRELPLTENLQVLMYGGVKDEISYEFSLAEKNGIPEIEKGYYCFINRHSMAISKDSDEDLHDVYSYNFTLALYDSRAEMLYFYELDT